MMKGSDSPYGHARSQSSAPLLPYADSPPPTPIFPSSRPKPRSPFLDGYRRRNLFFACAALSLVPIILFALSSGWRSPSDPQYAVSDLNQTTLHKAPTSTVIEGVIPQQNKTEIKEPENGVEGEIFEDAPLAHSPWLLGPPTDSFRDNLRNDTKYISSWISAGWTNDVMTYMNLLYLGKITDRVSIVGIFTPSHIGGDAPPIPFGEVFNVPRFIEDSGVAMVEWDEVKNPGSGVLDDLGCWGVWEAVQYFEHSPRGSPMLHRLGLDISYTKAPDWIKSIPNYEHDKCSTFWSLARLAYPEDREKYMGNATASPQHHAVLDPDEQLLCYDYLYYACSQQSFEFEFEYSPVWRYVGKYLRWAPQVEEVAGLYVKRVFGLPEDAEVPPYIAIHVRHGDFKNWCWAAETPEDCFAPLSVIGRRVREAQDEIRATKGIDIPMEHVIMTSDEKDQAWWDGVKLLGWAKMDHDELHTVEHYGRWYPVVLDAAIQSNGLGFIGTDRSTFSILSMRRVKDWHQGATRMVLWGKKDADAHKKRELLGLSDF